MTCHCPGGPSGAAHNERATAFLVESQREAEKRSGAKIAALEAELQRQRTSTTNYTIDRVTRIGPHLVMQVKYPHCEHRAYEGVKTMVFLNVTEPQALRWRSIDPHFRGAPEKLSDTEAPSPAARFPGNEAGWRDAMAYARTKAP